MASHSQSSCGGAPGDCQPHQTLSSPTHLGFGSLLFLNIFNFLTMLCGQKMTRDQTRDPRDPKPMTPQRKL